MKLLTFLTSSLTLTLTLAFQTSASLTSPRAFLAPLPSTSTSLQSLKTLTTLRCGGNLDPRYFLAGGVCAAFSHGITTPVDVVKTRLQSNPEKYSKGMLNALSQIVSEEGVSALGVGLAPTVTGYAIEGAIKFGVYECLKPVLSSILPGQQMAAFLIAACIAGAAASVMLCPLESVRIRQVTDASFSKLSMVSSLFQLVLNDGVLSLYSGLTAMLLKQVPYTMTKQVAFDVFAAYLYTLVVTLGMSSTDLKTGISALAAFGAAVLACLGSQPGDMILTQTYKGSTQKSATKIIAEIYKKNGVRGFFVGTGARLVHVSLIITSQLMVYDLVKQACGLPATGSH